MLQLLAGVKLGGKVYEVHLDPICANYCNKLQGMSIAQTAGLTQTACLLGDQFAFKDSSDLGLCRGVKVVDDPFLLFI